MSLANVISPPRISTCIQFTLPSTKESFTEITGIPDGLDEYNTIVEGRVFMPNGSVWYDFKDFGIQLIWYYSNHVLKVNVPTATDSVVLGKTAILKIIQV